MRPAIVAILILFAFSCKTGIQYPEGGYEYVKDYKPEDTGFYFLPVRDSFSRRDSFYAAWEGATLLPQYDEPNLSLNPVGENVYRLQWSGTLLGEYFITLRQDRIVVKTGVYDEEPVNCYDTAKLNEVEKLHLQLLERYFPFDNENLSTRKKRYIDSLINLYPELTDGHYYFRLKRKVFCNYFRRQYTTTTIFIQPKKYQQLVDIINKSGYWKMPPKIDGEVMCMDAPGYILEANTPTRYNCVISSECLENGNKEFYNICHQIKQAAGLIRKKTDTTQLVVEDIILEPMQKKENGNE